MRNRIAGLAYSGTGNLGDEIQSIAAIELLGQPDVWINRDQLNLHCDPDHFFNWIVLNGWFLSRPENWPPASNVVPLLTSFHLSPTPVYGTGYLPREILMQDFHRAFFKTFGPVGARDLDTRDFLLSQGVDAFFSGCLTLTLSRDRRDFDHDLIVLVDVHPNVAGYVTSFAAGKRIVNVTQTSHENSPQKRFQGAHDLLDLFSRARCVLTTRLHTAMPCLAIGTPVLLLDAGLDRRFSGLKDLTINLTTEEFLLDGRNSELWHLPDPPRKHLELKKALELQLKHFRERIQSEVKPTTFQLSEFDSERRRNYLSNQQHDLLIKIQRRLDEIQKIPNY